MGRGLFERGGLFYLVNVVVSVLHKELEYEVQMLKYKKLEIMQPRLKSEISRIDHPSVVQMKFSSGSSTYWFGRPSWFHHTNPGSHIHVNRP